MCANTVVPLDVPPQNNPKWSQTVVGHKQNEGTKMCSKRLLTLIDDIRMQYTAWKDIGLVDTKLIKAQCNTDILYLSQLISPEMAKKWLNLFKMNKAK